MLDNRGNDSNGSIPVLVRLGDGGGTENFTGDYSVTAVDAELAPSAGVYYHLNALQVFLAWNDGGAAAVDWEKYGPLAALTNGITLKARINGFTHNLLSDQVIAANADLWNPIFTEDHHHSMSIMAIFAFPDPIYLDGGAGDKLYLTLHDNFTGIASQRFAVIGHYSVVVV